MTDPIADMLTRIRNAQAVLAKTVDIPYSDVKYKIAKILEKQGFIVKQQALLTTQGKQVIVQKAVYLNSEEELNKGNLLLRNSKETENKEQKSILNNKESLLLCNKNAKIVVVLKYKNKLPAIRELKRISKPGVRTYIKAKNIKLIKKGYGFAILSTSEGLMTSKDAKRKNIGGEVLCEIW